MKDKTLVRRILMALVGMAVAGIAVGFALGFMPGIGTVITALFMGPLITFFKKKLSDPLLGKAGAEG